MNGVAVNCFSLNAKKLRMREPPLGEPVNDCSYAIDSQRKAVDINRHLDLLAFGFRLTPE